jgi:hypothetical protein
MVMMQVLSQQSRELSRYDNRTHTE